MNSTYEPIVNEDGKQEGTLVSPVVTEDDTIYMDDGIGSPYKKPIVFGVCKPKKADGTTWDQTNDAANHIRYALTLGLPQLQRRNSPRYGRAIIVGGAPSVKDHLETIRTLAADKDNAVFAINWTHTWLIENGIVPRGCVFFEIDAEPDTVLKNAHPDVTYFICSHCHGKTFDSLKDFKRILWHSPPNSDPEREVHTELADAMKGDVVGGGISTFTRTMAVAMFLGFRHFDLFGCDSSFPEDEGSHVEGYETIMDPDKDGLIVYATGTGYHKKVTRRYKTLGYLAYQHEEFKTFCIYNHQFLSLKVHGESLLRFTHEDMYPEQYFPDVYNG